MKTYIVDAVFKTYGKITINAENYGEALKKLSELNYFGIDLADLLDQENESEIFLDTIGEINE